MTAVMAFGAVDELKASPLFTRFNKAGSFACGVLSVKPAFDALSPLPFSPNCVTPVWLILALVLPNVTPCQIAVVGPPLVVLKIASTTFESVTLVEPPGAVAVGSPVVS
jgi:hypothetical protein